MSLVPCELCGALVTQRSLGRHKQHTHNFEVNRHISHYCFYCPSDDKSEFRQTSAYINHLNDVHITHHGGSIVVHTQAFPSSEEFEVFRNRIENEKSIQFRTRSSGDGFIHFRCNRYGNPDNVKKRRSDNQNEKPKRNRKSMTLTLYCPVFMNLDIKKDGSIIAKYCVDHLGHSIDISEENRERKNRRNLQKKLRKESEDKLRIGIKEMVKNFFENDDFKEASLEILETLKPELEKIIEESKLKMKKEKEERPRKIQYKKPKLENETSIL